MKKTRTLLPGLLLMLMFIMLLLPIPAYADNTSAQEQDWDNCYHFTKITVTRPEIGKTPAKSASAKAYCEWDGKGDSLTFVSISWEERASNTASWKKMTTKTFREGYYYKAVISFKSTKKEFAVLNDDDYANADLDSCETWIDVLNYDNGYYEDSTDEACYVSRDKTSAFRLYHQEWTFPKLSKITVGCKKSIKMTVNQSMTLEELGSLLNIRVKGSTFNVKMEDLSKVKKGDYYFKVSEIISSDPKKIVRADNYRGGGIELITYGASAGKCYITVKATLYRAVANYPNTSDKSQWNPENYGVLTCKIPVQVSYSSKSPELQSFEFTGSEKTKTIKVTMTNASTHTMIMKKGTYTVKNSFSAKKKLTVRLKKDVSIKSGEKKVITYNIVKGTYASDIGDGYKLQAKMKWNGKTGTIGLSDIEHSDSKSFTLTYKVGSKKYKINTGLEPLKYWGD